MLVHQRVTLMAQLLMIPKAVLWRDFMGIIGSLDVFIGYDYVYYLLILKMAIEIVDYPLIEW